MNNSNQLFVTDWIVIHLSGCWDVGLQAERFVALNKVFTYVLLHEGEDNMGRSR